MNEKEANAPEADADSALIADLDRALQSVVLRRKQPGEGIMVEARQLTQKWKVKECSEAPTRLLFDGTSSTTTLLLAGMVVALRQDHQLLEQIRRHFRNNSQILKQSWEKFLLMPWKPTCHARQTLRQNNNTRRSDAGSNSVSLNGNMAGQTRPLQLH